MKKINFCLVVAVSLLQACGHSNSPSENLPNQNVALDVKVQDEPPVDSAAEQEPKNDERVSPVTAVVISEAGLKNFTADPVPALKILSARALELSELSARAYNEIQKKWIGSTEAACNFFVITALCEAGYCKITKPFFKAADFDRYFRAEHWAEVSLAEAKTFLLNHSDLDLVAQKDGPSASGMGHIAVPVKVGEQNELWVAQANYHQSSHQLEVWGDRYAEPFRYFINFAQRD